MKNSFPISFKNSLLIIAALVLKLSSAQEIQFQSVESDVPYAQIVALPSRTADATIAYGSNEFQFGRLWRPTSAKANDKLLIMIHGGCWLNQFDMDHTFPLATALSQHGYTVWSLEYRRTGDAGGGWPGTFNDIKDGIEFGLAHADLGANNDSFAIMGHSAGGHLALLSGGEFPEASAVIGLAAISDVTKYSQGSNDCETATDLFMGATVEEAPQLYAAANPATAGTHKNSFLLHGTADAIVDLEQSKLEGAKTKIESGAGHFDWVHPGTDAFKLLLNTLEEAF